MNLSSRAKPDAMRPAEVVSDKSPCLNLNSQPDLPKQRTYVVLGVERGGTSMVAAIMRALGLDMGNERCGLNHEDPWFLTDDHEVLKRNIQLRNDDADVWGFKVPKSSLMWQFYEENLRNPYFILVFRNPVAIADSWRQRGSTEKYQGVFARVMQYYNELLNLMNQSISPCLIVNYERACISKHEAIEGIAEFLGTDVNKDNLTRAEQVITGDGSGYVNLPEHYFYVEEISEADKPEPCELLKVTDNLSSIQHAEDGFIDFAWPRVKLIWAPKSIFQVTSKKKSFFPKVFYLSFDFVPSPDLDLAERPFWFCFDYIDKIFLGHAARPSLKPGRNHFRIETNGMVKRFAIGGVAKGLRAKFENFCFFVEVK